MSWRNWRPVFAAVALAALAVVLARMIVPAGHEERQREQGRALFRGEAALPGRLAGHDAVLPPIATRCSNCHESEAAEAYAMRLGREWLTTPRVRRGGPPSAYDGAALCALLRRGTDPAQVLIATAMPRYEVSDSQCAALWAFLSAR